MSKLVNSLTVYAQCGRDAAIAINEGDHGRYTHERDWFNRALALEAPENRAAIRNTYAKAYSEARHVTFERKAVMMREPNKIVVSYRGDERENAREDQFLQQIRRRS